MNAYAPRTSEILTSLMAAQAATHSELLKEVSVGELIAALRNRAFGMSLILFGLPNILPIPGLPIICGLVLAILALQIAFGRETPWLPQGISARRISRSKLNGILSRALPWIKKIERFSRPRYAIATSALVRRVVGGTVFLLAILLIVMPIPWIGSMPQGVAIILFGLGIAERDGILIASGFVFSAIAALIGAGIAFALWYGANILF